MLNVGDKIQVIGWVMLEGMESGARYEVVRVRNGVYNFVKLNKDGSHSKRKRAAHLVKNVEAWIGGNSHNRIDIV